MKKLILILLIFTACKKEHPVKPQIKRVAVVFKLGDTVRWVSPNNPHPNDAMIIKAIYAPGVSTPEMLTLLEGTVYYTEPVGEVVKY